MPEPTQAVFLSYASQDAEAAKRICEALRAAGVEVWFDQSELVGGDAWDAKIRAQISGCALFLPVISANTQARREGYFRIEWKLAAQRTYAIADDEAFLLPIVIDDTPDAVAKVPAEFKAVQWTRLPGGETPPAFGARVKKLLEGNTEDRGQGSEARPQTLDPGPKPLKTHPRWLIPAIGAGIALAAGGAWLVLRPVRPLAANSAAASNMPASETKQLVARAWEQLDKIGAGRSEMELAEDLCKQALARDPNDADALAASSQVDSFYIYFGYQDTPERREAARAKAVRAMQIDPRGFESRLARAVHLTRAWGNLGVSDGAAEAEQLLRALLQERPGEHRALMTLGLLQRNLGRLPEAYAAFRQLTAIPAYAAWGWNELGWAQYTGREFAAAEDSADRSIAARPFWGNLALKIYSGLILRGDLEQARRMLAQMPATALQEDSGVSLAAYVYYLRREPAEALRILNNAPREWLSAGGRSGPRAGFAGMLHAMAGHDAAARTEFAAALKVIDQRLAERPNSPELLRWKARLLVRLGQPAAAEGLFRSVWEIEGGANPGLEAADLVLLGRDEEAINVLERTGLTRANSTAPALLRLEWELDPLQKNPRFLALLAKLEGQGRALDDKNPPDGGQKPGDGNLMASAVPRLGPKSVAVLPFENQTEERNANAFFADGVHEDVITNLVKVRDLKVISRTSVLAYRDPATRNLRRIAADLGVATVLEGSVRRAGNRVRVSATLTDARTDAHLWAETFDGDASDIFALQAELAQKIAAQLKATLTTDERALIERRLTKNPAAYEFYVQARVEISQRRLNQGYITLEDAERPMVLLRKAVELDPDFGIAWCELASSEIFKYRFWEKTAAQFELAKAALDTAARLVPESPEYHHALGNFHYRGRSDFARAADEYEKVLKVLPNDAVVWHDFAALNRRRPGRLAESLEQLERVAQYDPKNLNSLDDLMITYSMLRRFPEAIDVQRRVVELKAGDLRQAHRLAYLNFLARGSTAEVDALFAGWKPPEAESPAGKEMRAAWALVRGQWDEARRICPPQTVPADQYAARQLFATMLIAQGDRPAAMQLLEPCPALIRATLADRPTDAYLLADLARTEALLGHREEALRYARQAQAVIPESLDRWDGPALSLTMAFVESWTGDKGAAIREYERLLKLGGRYVSNVHEMRRDPFYFPLQGDARFEAILADPKNNAPIF